MRLIRVQNAVVDLDLVAYFQHLAGEDSTALDGRAVIQFIFSRDFLDSLVIYYESLDESLDDFERLCSLFSMDSQP